APGSAPCAATPRSAFVEARPRPRPDRCYAGASRLCRGAGMPGLVFGKYEKIRRLAEGGMGEVWLARQVASVKGFDRLVILKALKSDLAEEAGFVEQFLDEA